MAVHSHWVLIMCQALGWALTFLCFTIILWASGTSHSRFQVKETTRGQVTCPELYNQRVVLLIFSSLLPKQRGVMGEPLRSSVWFPVPHFVQVQLAESYLPHSTGPMRSSISTEAQKQLWKGSLWWASPAALFMLRPLLWTEWVSFLLPQICNLKH